MRNVAVGANQNPLPPGCDKFGGGTGAQVIEKSAAIAEPRIGHPVSRVQVPKCEARRQRACSVVERKLVRGVTPSDGSRLVKLLA